MKGQFFIISTVIMISAMILITQYLYDYGKVDLTQVEQMQELNYIGDIQNSLRTAVEVSCNHGSTERLDDDLLLAEEFLENKLLEKGIVLEISHTNANCVIPNADFTFTMKSSDFDITDSFSV